MEIVVTEEKTKHSIRKEEYDTIEAIKAKYAEIRGILPKQFELEVTGDNEYQATITDETLPEKTDISQFLYESKFIRMDIPDRAEGIKVTPIQRSSVVLIVKFMIRQKKHC